MNYSHQQLEVIDHEGDMVVNAVAGSGKTTTLAGYAQKRRGSKILYLAFNNSVKTEAKEKFQRLGLSNVRVETAHSLALKSYRVKPKISQVSYQPFDAKQFLGFQQKDAIADMKFGKHVLQLASAFCNSTVEKVADLDYLKLISNPEDLAFVKEVYDRLTHETRRFLGMMKSGEIEMTHDFYLKMFQLSQPQLGTYDYILFDEAQDASPVMLDVFLNQRAIKVMVGDEHQQIYGWRHAVNALQSSSFEKKNLTLSYRFNQEIAELAKAVLDTKQHLEEIEVPDIQGKGGCEEAQVHATLGRTNSSILVDVIERLIEREEIESVYFEGHFQSYTYADEGGSVYDVLNLYLDQRKGIRNPMIRQFKDFAELQEYTDQSGDAPMKGIIDVVMSYGRELPHLINCIKENHVDHVDKNQADMIYSTVHKAKGMEYDHVNLLDGFLGEEKLKEYLERSDVQFDEARLQEDINILYVALTRAKGKVALPIGLIPEEFSYEGKNSIEVLNTYLSPSFNLPDIHFDHHQKLNSERKKSKTDKSYSYKDVRQTKPSAYSPWSLEDDLELEQLFVQRTSIKELAEHFGRSKGAIASRIKKLELREKYFDV